MMRLLISKPYFLTQQKILLAPGEYFHSEYSGVDYSALPPVLQRVHNRRLLTQYQLPMPNAQLPVLPDIITEHWTELPKIAWALGVFLLPDPLPWWVQISGYANLRQRINTSIMLRPEQHITSPQTLLAVGAAQLLASLAPFGTVYTIRASYMFHTATRLLMAPPVNGVLPWNIIEGACQYVRQT